MTEYTFETFRNDTKFNFIDISSELWRQYERKDSFVIIHKPLALHTSKSGGHRIFDASGTSHYIPSGWIHLSWEVKKDMPHFVA